jgi:hypothetical protein
MEENFSAQDETIKIILDFRHELGYAIPNIKEKIPKLKPALVENI